MNKSPCLGTKDGVTLEMVQLVASNNPLNWKVYSFLECNCQEVCVALTKSVSSFEFLTSHSGYAISWRGLGLIFQLKPSRSALTNSRLISAGRLKNQRRLTKSNLNLFH